MPFFVRLLRTCLLAFMPAYGGAFPADTLWQNLEQHCDTLKNMLESESITPKRKLEIYDEINGIYAAFSPDSVIAYAPKAIDLARTLKEHAQELSLRFHLGAAYCFKGDYDRALNDFDAAKELAVKYRNKQSEGNAISMTAFTYVQQGKYHTAIDYYLKALTIFENGVWPEGCVMTLTNLAEIYRKLNNPDLAIRYLDKAAKTCEDAKPWLTGRYEWRIVQIYNEYAFNYLEQGNTDGALRYASMADSINGGNEIINKYYTNKLLTAVYLRLNNHDRALQCAEEAYRQANILKDKNLYVMAKKALSDVYLAMKRYPEAEVEALNAWRIDSTDMNESRIVAENIALANIYMRREEKAAYYLKKYAELNGRYSEESFHTTVSDMAIKYETDKKEMRITVLERQKILYVAIGMAGILLAGALWVIFRQKIKSEQKERQIVASNAVYEWEKKERKRFADELHDGINGMLTAMKIELNATGNSTSVCDKLDDCIETIRRMARSMMPDSLERYGMKTALNDYCYSFPNVRFHFFGENMRIDKKMEFAIYCCAGELINNSIKHSGAKNIHLQLVQDEKHVTLIVSDDGRGFNEKNVAKGSGLKNVRDRVASCNGKIDVFTSPNNGTEIIIELKVEN